MDRDLSGTGRCQCGETGCSLQIIVRLGIEWGWLVGWDACAWILRLSLKVASGDGVASEVANGWEQGPSVHAALWTFMGVIDDP
jgi:hypothetical protein